MILSPDAENWLKTRLCETILLLCKSGLKFESQFSVDGLLAVTIDRNEVLLVNIREVVDHNNDDSGNNNNNINNKNNNNTTTVQKKCNNNGSNSVSINKNLSYVHGHNSSSSSRRKKVKPSISISSTLISDDDDGGDNNNNNDNNSIFNCCNNKSTQVSQELMKDENQNDTNNNFDSIINSNVNFASNKNFSEANRHPPDNKNFPDRKRHVKNNKTIDNRNSLNNNNNNSSLTFSNTLDDLYDNSHNNNNMDDGNEDEDLNSSIKNEIYHEEPSTHNSTTRFNETHYSMDNIKFEDDDGDGDNLIKTHYSMNNIKFENDDEDGDIDGEEFELGKVKVEDAGDDYHYTNFNQQQFNQQHSNQQIYNDQSSNGSIFSTEQLHQQQSHQQMFNKQKFSYHYFNRQNLIQHQQHFNQQNFNQRHFNHQHFNQKHFNQTDNDSNSFSSSYRVHKSTLTDPDQPSSICSSETISNINNKQCVNQRSKNIIKNTHRSLSISNFRQPVNISTPTSTTTLFDRNVVAGQQQTTSRTSTKLVKKRVILSLDHTRILENYYQNNFNFPYPDWKTCESLASQCGISSSKVNKWFSNRRNRDKNTRNLTEIANRRGK